MTGNLSMGPHKITALGKPVNETDAATKGYMDHSHLSQSGEQKNHFAYLMEDTDDSSSENNISVRGMVNFAAFPHQINKNAYEFTLIKDEGSNDYRSEIGFNLFPRPKGYYTFVVEYFPPEMTNVSVKARATVISITHQTTRTFNRANPPYTKTLIQFHRWSDTTPNFIFLYLHGTTSGSTTCHLVVYGVSRYVSSVNSSVFYVVWVVENRNMTLQAPLDMNGKVILNPKLRGDLNLNYNGVINDGQELFAPAPGISGMEMRTSLDLNGMSLYGLKLGKTFDLGGPHVKNGSAPLFDGTSGEVTMLDNINMNSFLLKEPKLGGNLNLNDRAVYNNDTPLFRYRNGAIRFWKPVVWPGMVCRVDSDLLTATSVLEDTFSMPQFWALFTLFNRISRLELQLAPSPVA